MCTFPNRQRGIELSTSSLSYLCDRFLTHTEALHLARAPQLRSALGEGYPLHIDATYEHGKGGLFVCMDGWRGWVSVVGCIPSEHEDHLRPLVEKATGLFGEPIAVVRDRCRILPRTAQSNTLPSKGAENGERPWQPLQPP